MFQQLNYRYICGKIVGWVRDATPAPFTSDYPFWVWNAMRRVAGLPWWTIIVPRAITRRLPIEIIG